jgi:hypothetical protein
MTDMSGNPLFRENPKKSHWGPQATSHAPATNQSIREPRLIYFFGLGHLWIEILACLAFEPKTILPMTTEMVIIH